MYDYRKLTPEQQKQTVTERLQQGRPAHAPPHSVCGESSFLFSAACFEHKTLMNNLPRRLAFYEKIQSLAPEFGMQMHAWVILPNHYHLLAWLEDSGQAAGFFQRLHGAMSHQWNKEDDTRGRQVWYRYTDRAVRSERHYYTSLNYIHYNPVKHAYADSPYAWESSSVHWYAESKGRDWLRETWRAYPLLDYGKNWDD